MNSEILRCRAKVEGSKNWIYRQPFHIRGTWYMYSSIWQMVRINHKTIGRTTGLKDKDNQEIFEGDITRAIDGEKRIVCYDIHQTKYKAVPVYAYLHNAGEGGWTGYDLRSDQRLEVIGNIHDNPGLLKVPEC